MTQQEKNALIQPWKVGHLKHQLSVLKELAVEYPTHTIENIIQQIQSRIDHYAKKD